MPIPRGVYFSTPSNVGKPAQAAQHQRPDLSRRSSRSSTTPPNGSNNPFGAPSYSYATGALTSTANSITESYYIRVNQAATMISG